MLQYQNGLKLKVQDALILKDNLKDIKELINRAIKIDNRIYQYENAKKTREKLVQRTLQALRQQYSGLKPIDLSSTKKPRKQGNNKRQQKPKEGGSNN